MLGTKIILDEDKILREGKYNLAKAYQAIDRFAQEYTLYNLMSTLNTIERERISLRILSNLTKF